MNCGLSSGPGHIPTQFNKASHCNMRKASISLEMVESATEKILEQLLNSEGPLNLPPSYSLQNPCNCGLHLSTSITLHRAKISLVIVKNNHLAVLVQCNSVLLRKETAHFKYGKLVSYVIPLLCLKVTLIVVTFPRRSMTVFHEKVGGDKIEGVCAMTLKFCPSIQKSWCLQKIIKNIYFFLVSARNSFPGVSFLIQSSTSICHSSSEHVIQ